MKTVKTLDKKKHRQDIWADRDGVLWFYDNAQEDWFTLEAVNSLLWESGQGFYLDSTVDDADVDWPDGPFVRVFKGPRRK